MIRLALLALALAVGVTSPAPAATRGQDRGGDRAGRLRGQNPGSSSYGQSAAEAVPGPLLVYGVDEPTTTLYVQNQVSGLHWGITNTGITLQQTSLIPDGEGKAADIDQADADSFFVPDDDALDIGTTWTIMFWATLVDCASGADAFFAKDPGTGGGNNPRFIVYFSDSGTNVLLNVYSRGANFAATATTGYGTNHWAVTCSAGSLTYFKNGASYDTDTGLSAPDANAAPLWIGHFNHGGAAEPGCDNERVQGVAYWPSTALTAAQILRIYNAAGSAP